MPLVLIVACYFAGAVALVSVGMMGWSMLAAPTTKMKADGERPKLIRKADRDAPGQPAEATRPSGDFRYGPEVNHGRADTPVNYRDQALKAARLGPAASAWARAPSKPYRDGTYRAPRIDPGTRPSGH